MPVKKLRPVSTASSFDLGTRIGHLLEGQNHGIWSDEVAAMYIKRYQEGLPDNWVKLVKDSSEVEVIHVGGKAIIAPKTDFLQSSSPKFPSPPPLELPEKPHWDIFVTLPLSTKEVWVRLIGYDYSAVKCSLEVLEKYADDPASEEYSSSIRGLILVAEVKSRTEPYSIELYDTSTDDNVHMGEEWLQKLDAQNSATIMPPRGGIQRDVKTYVSHVSDTGEIFLQFHTKHFQILQALVEDITPEIVQANQMTNLEAIDTEKLYLAKFTDDKWYRAAITNINSLDDIEVFYIDYGNSHNVPLNELLSLDKLPPLLSLIFPQAILAHLESIPPSVFSEKLAEKIREMVTDDTEVLVKRTSEDEIQIPRVEIFIRMPPSNILASINNTIVIDPEFKKDSSSVKDNSSESGKHTGSSPSDLQPFELPKTKDDTLHVYVVNVANPHNFSIQTEESRKTLENLEKEMNNFYTKYPLSKKKDLEIGPTYAVRIVNGKWQRFTITSFLDTAQCIGSFPDTGGLQIVPVQDIFPLMPTYKKGAYKPALATSAKLSGVEPKCKDWDVMDTFQFQSMVKEKKLKCHIVNMKKQLEIELFDCSGSEEKNIGQLLIHRKCAVRSS